MFFVWSVTKSYLTDFRREHCAWKMVGMAENWWSCLRRNKSVSWNGNFVMKLVIFLNSCLFFSKFVSRNFLCKSFFHKFCIKLLMFEGTMTTFEMPTSQCLQLFKCPQYLLNIMPTMSTEHNAYRRNFELNFAYILFTS